MAFLFEGPWRRQLMYGAIAFTMAGCSTSPAPFASDEADPTRSRHTVRFDVLCDACSVRYTTPAGSGREEVTRRWTRDVRIWVTESGASVELTAVPAGLGRGPVESARILVDGAVVAQHFGGAAPVGAGRGIVLRAIVEKPPAAQRHSTRSPAG